MRYARIVIVESGEALAATHLVLGATSEAVAERASQVLRETIDQIAAAHPKAKPTAKDLEAALKDGCWQTDIGSDKFKVMVLKPDRVEQLRPTVRITVQGGVATVEHVVPGVDVVICDYDVDGVDDHELQEDDESRRYVRQVIKGT